MPCPLTGVARVDVDSGRWRVSGQQSKIPAAKGAQRPEVLLIESQDSVRSVSLGHDNDAEICQPRVDVVVTTLKLQDYSVIVGVQACNRETSAGQIVDERQPCRSTKAAAEQVVNFRGHRGGDHDLTILRSQQRLDLRLHPVTPVSQGYDGPSVEDQAHEPKSLSSSSSDRSAIESPGPSAIRRREKLRSPAPWGSYRLMARRMTSA